MYLIKRTDKRGLYVAQPGRKNSYTNVLRYARKFRTKEEAEKERCEGNEIVIDMFKHIFGS